MGLTEDIQKMQTDGMNEQDIIDNLSGRGLAPTQISEALNQAKIKQAVTDQETEDNSYPVGTNQADINAEAMQPSIMLKEGSSSVNEVYTAPTAPVQEAYPPQQPQYAQPYTDQQQYSDQYAQYQPSGLSADTITEIADQVVNEKIASFKESFEKLIDMRSTFDSRINFIEQRINKIEKIIDRLQLSVLQKVGEYMTNVEDIKKEVIETQKSFKALLPRSAQTPQQNPQSNYRQ